MVGWSLGKAKLTAESRHPAELHPGWFQTHPRQLTCCSCCWAAASSAGEAACTHTTGGGGGGGAGGGAPGPCADAMQTARCRKCCLARARLPWVSERARRIWVRLRRACEPAIARQICSIPYDSHGPRSGEMREVKEPRRPCKATRRQFQCNLSALCALLGRPTGLRNARCMSAGTQGAAPFLQASLCPAAALGGILSTPA